jgi:hypothetical protein
MNTRRPLSVSYLLALTTVALAPNQYLGTITKMGLRLTPADIMLGLTLIAFVIESWRRRSRIIWPPAVLWALVGVAAVSPLASPGATLLRAEWARTAVRESAQMVEWFLVAYLIFRNVLDSRSRVRTAVWVLTGVTAALVAYAVWQKLLFDGPMRVSGTFGTLGRELHPSRHAYGAYLALALPIMLGLVGAIGQPGPTIRGRALAMSLALVLLTVLGIATISSGGALIAVVAGLVGVIAVSGRRSPAIAAAVVAVVIGVLPWRLIQSGDVGLRELGNFSEADGVNTLYSEWHAGLNILERHFPTGVGLGNYDSNIRVYYLGPQLEWDSQNGYIVLGSTGGWLALAMLMAALAYFGGVAVRTARSAPTGEGFGLAAGLAGALVGLVVAQVYSSLLIRGTGLVIGLIFALIAVLGSREEIDRETQPTASNP